MENIPEHDESHKWVLYLPNLELEEGLPSALTVTPLLNINQEGFTKELQREIQNKSRIIAAQGAGRKNWVVVIAQGFPVEPQWYSDLQDQWPHNVDGIVIAASDFYLSASHDLLPYHDLTMVLLKCPLDATSHNCYHPSYLYRVSQFDEKFQPISPETHSAEDLSLAAFRMTWPPDPTRRTFIVRDENGNEIDRLENIAITGQQAFEVLKERNFVWREHSETRMVLSQETDSSTAIIWAEVVVQSEGIVTYWAGTAYRGEGELRQEIGEEFETWGQAAHWCEVQVATMLLDNAG